MCEKVILHYIGFVKNHMKKVENGKHAGTAREGKFFYQVSICYLFPGCSSKNTFNNSFTKLISMLYYTCVHLRVINVFKWYYTVQ